MKKLSLAAAAAFAVIALGGCHRSNEDQLGENVEANGNGADNLDALSQQAANVASEAQNLQNQANAINAVADNMSNQGAQTPADENIQGM